MKDPVRLLQEHPSALARALLDAASTEEPHSTLLANTLRIAVGSAGAALAQSSLLPAAAASPPTSLGTATATPLATAGVKGAAWLATTVKWVGVASVGAALTVSGVRAYGPQRAALASSPPATHQLLPVPAKANEALVPFTPTIPSALPPTDHDETTRTLSTLKPARATAPVAPSAGGALALLLSDEAGVVDAARAAVARGDGAKALRVLEDHRKRFERPQLHPETLYLRMQALRLQGNAEAAAHVAERLLNDYPNGPQSAAARALLNARGQ